ncbi:MAG: hypothetical protein ACI9Y1_002163 [Lentisphaeria bacterium]|jgi:hypothetical protein
MYDFALQEKQRLHNEMLKLAMNFWPEMFTNTSRTKDNMKVLKTILDTVSQKHASADQFVQAVKDQIPEIEAFVASRGLMDTDPEKPLVVRETPEYQRGFSIASIEAPGPYDSAANTYYNVSPVDDLDPALRESHLRE